MFAGYVTEDTGVTRTETGFAVNLSPAGSPVTLTDARLALSTSSVIGSNAPPVSYSSAKSPSVNATQSSSTGMNDAKTEIASSPTTRGRVESRGFRFFGNATPSSLQPAKTWPRFAVALRFSFVPAA